jgi:hypothetical protein
LARRRRPASTTSRRQSILLKCAVSSYFGGASRSYSYTGYTGSSGYNQGYQRYQSLTSSYLAPSKPPQSSKVGSLLASTAKGIYNLVIGDDINTLRDPHASTFSKVMAGVSIASNFIPGEGLVKLGGKLAIKEGIIAYKALKEPVRAAAKAVAETASKAVERVGGFFKGLFGGGGKKVVEGAGNTLNRIDSGSGHIPMDADKFNRMKNAFEKQGGLIVKEDEALPLLNYHGVEASTLDATTIAFRPNPSTSAVFEEFIHATQYRTGRANGNNIIEMEIKAKEKLINFRKAYGIPNSETRDTIQQLREYRQMLGK